MTLTSSVMYSSDHSTTSRNSSNRPIYIMQIDMTLLIAFLVAQLAYQLHSKLDEGRNSSISSSVFKKAAWMGVMSGSRTVCTLFLCAENRHQWQRPQTCHWHTAGAGHTFEESHRAVTEHSIYDGEVWKGFNGTHHRGHFFIQLDHLPGGRRLRSTYSQHGGDTWGPLPEYQRKSALLNIIFFHVWSIIQLFIFQRIGMALFQNSVQLVEHFCGQVAWGFLCCIDPVQYLLSHTIDSIPAGSVSLSMAWNLVHREFNANPCSGLSITSWINVLLLYKM